MDCDSWRGKLDAYLDGELASSDAATVNTHLRGCATCAADALERVQLKRSLAAAGRRYAPSMELKTRIAGRARTRPGWDQRWKWILVGVPALVVLAVSLFAGLNLQSQKSRQQRVYSELADLHVAALASANPVDVISTDRHTVKPWFEGKIPFTFNLPELQGSDFILVGGRVTYFSQEPGAHLIYRIRKHELSVFIFQDRAEPAALPAGSASALSFHMENWNKNGLRYFVVGDVVSEDVAALSKLLRDAN